MISHSRPIAAITVMAASVSLHAQGPSDRSTNPSRTAAPVVHELAPVEATASQMFRNIFMLRENSTGRVLVNDGLRRQLVLLDKNLTNPVVVIDSLNEGGQAYGPIASPLVRYVGDSSLFVDMIARSLLVLDEKGAIVRTMAAPKQSDMLRMWGEASGTDANGNLLYRGGTAFQFDTATLAGGVTTRRQWQPDSIGIVRGVVQTRVIDTIARLKLDNTSRTFHTVYPSGMKTLTVTLNPLTPIDEWAPLSNGAIALIRGRDYSVDFIMADGSKKSTGKLPYPWKALAQEDKQRIVDSTRAVIERIREAAARDSGETAGNDAVVRYTRTRLTPVLRPDAPPPPDQKKYVEPTITVEFAPLKEIADYVPPLRYGSARADEDGNVWILPTTSDQSRKGELVYDVVNSRTLEFSRVRMPIGKSVAGFGKNGVIYLMSRHGDDWLLERTRLATKVSVKD